MPLTCPASKKRTFADMDGNGYLDMNVNLQYAWELGTSAQVGGLQRVGPVLWGSVSSFTGRTFPAMAKGGDE